jgi:hypothetical protein
MSIIQTQPSGSGSSGSSFRTLYIVPPGVTQGADGVLTNNIIAAKWLISIRNTINNDTSVFEVLATHNTISASHNISNVVGTLISVIVDVKIVASSMVIEITNNISDTIELRIQNITMSI